VLRIVRGTCFADGLECGGGVPRGRGEPAGTMDLLPFTNDEKDEPTDWIARLPKLDNSNKVGAGIAFALRLGALDSGVLLLVTVVVTFLVY